jgi:hypothetical protein
MPSYSTHYRHSHPEYALKELEATKKGIMDKSHNDPEYKEN